MDTGIMGAAIMSAVAYLLLFGVLLLVMAMVRMSVSSARRSDRVGASGPGPAPDGPNGEPGRDGSPRQS